MNLIFLTFAGILVLSVICGKLIRAYHFKYATEGSASLLLGTVITGFVSLCYWLFTKQPLPEHSLQLPDSVFFRVLLPPIIFYAGFSIKKRMFFANFCTIFTFGFFGTLTSAVLISWAAAAALRSMGLAPKLWLQSALALGAICACSDTVGILQIMDKRGYPVLYNLVFGEGIVNDAVSVVLLTAVNKLTSQHTAWSFAVVAELLLSFVSLFVSSLVLGVGMGLLSALLVRHIFGKQHDCDREVLLLALLGYMSYVLADVLQLSAILAVFFCGVTMSHYTWHSMCPAAQALALHTFRLAAGLMEMILYAYSGINIWTSGLWQYPAPDSHMHLQHALKLSGVLLVAIFASRVACTYPVATAASWLMSCSLDTQQQQQQQQHRRHISCLDATVMLWGGLARGAITLALAYHHFSPERKEVLPADHQVMILAVVIIVLVSTVVLGTVTGPLMEWIMAQHKTQQHKQHQPQQTQQQESTSATGWAAHAPPTAELQQPLLSGNASVAASAQGAATASNELLSPAGPDCAGWGSIQRKPGGTMTLHGPSGADSATAAAGACGISSSSMLGVASIVSDKTGPASYSVHCPSYVSTSSSVHFGQQQSTPLAISNGLGHSNNHGSRASNVAAQGRLLSLDEATGHMPHLAYDNGVTVASSLDNSNRYHCMAPGHTGVVLSRVQQDEAQVAAASSASSCSAAAVASYSARGELQLQQQQLMMQLQSLIRKQLQCYQLGGYVDSGAPASAVPFVAIPSGPDAMFAPAGIHPIGAHFALSQSPSLHVVLPVEQNDQQLQQDGSMAVQQYAPEGLLRASNAAPLTSALAGLQAMRGDVTSADSSVVSGQRWYLQQQLQLLHQLAQLQQKAQLHQHRQHAAVPVSTGSTLLPTATVAGPERGSVHRVWKWFDVTYMQPVFGGREMALRTSIPMEFQHYGVEV